MALTTVTCHLLLEIGVRIAGTGVGVGLRVGVNVGVAVKVGAGVFVGVDVAGGVGDGPKNYPVPQPEDASNKRIVMRIKMCVRSTFISIPPIQLSSSPEINTGVDAAWMAARLLDYV